jgi:outer membrane protein assembly factor BamA
MSRRLLLACAVILTGSLHAQDCIPASNSLKPILAPINAIHFGGRALPEEQKQLEIVKLLRARIIDPSSVPTEMASLGEEAGERAQIAFQNEGYLKAEVTSEAVPALVDKSQYDINVTIRSIGKQYRLGELRIVKATLFPTQQLLDLFSIHQGEIFSRVKVAHGLEELRRLYGSEGYINFTPAPETEIDDEHSTINLSINANEGKQFRLRTIEVLGLDPDAKARVLDDIDLKPGEILNSAAVERVFAEFGDHLQNPNPSGARKNLDEQNGLADIVFDFTKPDCTVDTHLAHTVALGPPRP